MPPTWPEARAAKDERLRREARYFHPGNTAKRRCPGCGGKMSQALVDVGFHAHPCCSDPSIMPHGRVPVVTS